MNDELKGGGIRLPKFMAVVPPFLKNNQFLAPSFLSLLVVFVSQSLDFALLF